MTSRTLDLKDLITDAWDRALKKAKRDGESAGQTHRERSSAWIDCLGTGFQEHYSEPSQLVFWRHNYDNQRQFGLNELLFDLLVCQVEELESARHKIPLQFVSKCHWLVESELDNESTREITKDFSKLIMGRSDNKLFISSYQGTRQEQVLDMCSKMAGYCKGELYMCFIDHPKKWRDAPKAPVVFQWNHGSWNPL